MDVRVCLTAVRIYHISRSHLCVWVHPVLTDWMNEEATFAFRFRYRTNASATHATSTLITDRQWVGVMPVTVTSLSLALRLLFCANIDRHCWCHTTGDNSRRCAPCTCTYSDHLLLRPPSNITSMNGRFCCIIILALFYLASKWPMAMRRKHTQNMVCEDDMKPAISFDIYL